MVSCIILTKNEEQNIKNCLECVKWCGEIIIIDDYSTDRTPEIVKSYPVRIFQRNLNHDFASQRNFGLEKAKGDWVLFVDADERITEELAEEIMSATKTGEKNKQISGYFLKRQDYLFGKMLKYGETGKIKLLRLARKNSGRWERKVHETWCNKDNHTSILHNPIKHYPHQSLTEFLKEINYYSDLNALVFIEQGKITNIWEILFYPIGKFFVNYIWKLGFLDGTPGFIQAVMMSLHSFLTRGKIWTLKNKPISSNIKN